MGMRRPRRRWSITETCYGFPTRLSTTMTLISNDVHPVQRTATDAIALLRKRGAAVTLYSATWLAHNLTGDGGYRLPQRRPSANLFIVFTVRIYDES